ncbi:hypothetical protein CKM354_000432400 [Cercospora kikuchii]|uniref:Mid2 domain-containing protein n=1 Tax=Cercospora kikuchii TaxID=84275 RepID=A0A9P3CDY9_9PEZI|nr:uncharacterized protein CKM354_000432400 [Cercospora kikuchii]GIZ41006.1 hypothetical protein CKM354_000432400 [Cercospora kikuchii]
MATLTSAPTPMSSQTTASMTAGPSKFYKSYIGDNNGNMTMTRINETCELITVTETISDNLDPVCTKLKPSTVVGSPSYVVNVTATSSTRSACTQTVTEIVCTEPPLVTSAPPGDGAPPSDSPRPGDSGNEMSTGMAASVGVGCAVGLALLTGLVVWWCRPKKKRARSTLHVDQQMAERDNKSSPYRDQNSGGENSEDSDAGTAPLQNRRTWS